jgi:hypothetical protein
MVSESQNTSEEAYAFERKVRLSRLALFFEALWPRLGSSSAWLRRLSSFLSPDYGFGFPQSHMRLFSERSDSPFSRP